MNAPYFDNYSNRQEPMVCYLMNVDYLSLNCIFGQVSSFPNEKVFLLRFSSPLTILMSIQLEPALHNYGDSQNARGDSRQDIPRPD